MASPAGKLQVFVTTDELDKIFLKIFNELGKDAMDGATACTASTMALSANYLERSAFETLKQFYDIYFAHGAISSKKDEVNSAVDDMVSLLQDQLAAGQDISEANNIDQDEEMRKQRLSLAGVQKQLEGLITLDNGIREQVIPALASMQFEDAVNQRLEHVNQMWSKAVEVFNQPQSPLDLTETARDISKKLSSVEESKDFYELVLQEKAPEGQDQRSIFIEF